MQHATLTVVLNPEEPDLAKQNVVVLRKWSAGQRTRVASASMAPIDAMAAAATLRDGGSPPILIDVNVKRLEMLKVCIASWSGPIFEGTSPTPDAVEDLDDDVFDQLVGPCEQLISGLTSDEKKASAPPTNTP